MSELHNICCLLADSLRWDVFVEAQPVNIPKLGSVRKAWSLGCCTLPSVVAYLMNYPPLGVGGQFFTAPGAGEAEGGRWMPRYLKEQGYRTIWMSSNAVPLRFDSETGGLFSKHFDHWGAIKYQKDVATPEIIRDLDLIIEEEKDHPIFAVILLLDTHSPYHDGRGNVALIDPKQPDINRQRQVMGMKYIDNVFPNFIRIFSKTNRPTEFIFTSDHGERFGGPGGFGHSPFRPMMFGEELFAIPWMRAWIRDWSKVQITTTILKGDAYEDYWDQRYALGGSSGQGSVEQRDWKWIKMLAHIEHIFPIEVIDVGCGDLSFWHSPFAPPVASYVGIDKSKVVIEKNLVRVNSGEWSSKMRFINSPAEKFQESLAAPVVLCMDLLFHIMEDEAYVKTLMNLCRYSTRYIFIHTWARNPFKETDTDGIYQKYRDFEAKQYQDIFGEAGFQLLNKFPNPNEIGAMYIYRKVN